jgi:hypothetical protein
MSTQQTVLNTQYRRVRGTHRRKRGLVRFTHPTSDRAQCTPGTSVGAKRAGLTLAELLVVVAILVVLGSLVLPAVGHYMSDSRDAITRQSLTRLRDVIAVTYWSDMQSLPRPDAVVSPSRAHHPQLRYLFVNPNTEGATLAYDPVYRRGWRGPYLVQAQGAAYTTASFSNLYGENGDPAVPDGWGRPMVIQNPGTLADGRLDVRVVSAGPDGVLTVPATMATLALTSVDTGDDVWIAFEVRP